jgi:signal transduction histidine kinase
MAGEVSGIKVLNVDDYEPGLYARSKVLRQAGFDVIEAQNGKDTLEIIRQEKPQIVLLDIHLPDIDGWEICRQIKADTATMAVQIVHVTSSFPGAPDRARALDLGADGYLVEPVEPEVLIATVRSLARTRRAEEAVRAAARQWQATFDAISDAVCVLDRAGKVVRLNAVFSTLLGEEVSDLRQTPLAPLLGAPGHRTEDIRLGERWYRAVVDPLRDEEGALDGTVCVLSDVTVVKQSERVMASLLEREQGARADAESANRAKDEFLAVLSHELRTPLTAMLGWARMLGTGLPPEQTRHGIEVIERNTRLQARIIEDLLDVSRIISGKLQLDLRPVEVERLVRSAVDGQREAAQAKNLALDISMAPDLPVLLADPNRLQQIVGNLVSNAIKFTPREGRVAVDVRMDHRHLVIVVTDTGQGIAPEFLPHIFERFRQAETSSRRGHGGLGLGLAIVQHLAALHGGSVRAASEGIDRGTTFTVTLPVRQAPTAREMVGGRISRPPLPSRNRPLDGITALVVDDDPDALDLLRAVLEHSGATVVAARSVAAALGELDLSVPDVILSDVGMPGEDGYDLMRAVRARSAERGGDRPAIAVTAYAGSTDSASALAAGYQRHVAKPIDPAVLVSAIAEVLGLETAS